MNETINTLKSRRSCRKFKNEMIKDEDLKQIIEAGTYAPTGHGSQSPIIIAVTKKELRDKIAEENRKIGGWSEGFDPFYGAPVILIVLADKSKPTYIYDGSLVLGNMLNAAEKSLNIEGDYEGIGHCAIGYRDAEKLKAAPRKDNYVYYIN